MDRLLLLCAALALFLPYSASDSAVQCGRPKDVANAIINAGDTALVNTILRYTCKLGYKRKAGTSTLIQCILISDKPVWTHTELQCIRDPALPPQTPSPELPTVTTSQRGTNTPSATVPVPSPETSVPPAMPKPPEMPTPAEGTALGTTPLPTIPMDHVAVSTQTLASSIGKHCCVDGKSELLCFFVTLKNQGCARFMPLFEGKVSKRGSMQHPNAFPWQRRYLENALQKLCAV
ncbi:interleukin-15 receptor subunit alpha isoform X1 [Gallus gallus]|uniref:interleukin-15 receptor subunit alpha isoform X1 n=1 Tax=Gallus gallus TaxID=9031 RepID=UPI001AE2898C|nr:interleukin-15 receptor subunit alpha isoform X1 [Gallus gallus]XP_025008886.2 interleukin-15 receptor subunit alpha isoform X1 [Gallus gallus]